MPEEINEIPLRQNLRAKIITIVIVTSIISILAAIIGNTKYSTLWPIVFSILLLDIVISILLILKSLKPLEELYRGIKILSKGELKHRFNIHTGDEIEAISQSLNTIAKNLDDNLQTLSQSKDFISSQRNKLEVIIASMVDGVIVIGLHHNVLIVNKSAEEMTGYSSEEMLGNPVDSLIVMKDEKGNIVSSNDYYKILPDETNNVPQIFKAVHLISKNGKDIIVNAVITHIHEAIQTDLGCILTLHDITQNKQLEQMQIDFVSMASHEIRTPLTSIINYLATIDEEAKLKSEHKEFLNRALTSAQQLSALVDNILNVSRIERGAVSVSLAPLDWKKIVTIDVENNQGQAIQKHIYLHLNLPDTPLPKVLADEIRINEVLNNLINNAIVYSKEGGEIEVKVIVEGDQVITSVADNGPGMPQEAIPHLFTKFFRVSGALEKGSKGTGLGLYISKSIIDLHHGKIWVESAVGKGSTFYFSLPIENSVKNPSTIAQLNS